MKTVKMDDLNLSLRIAGPQDAALLADLGARCFSEAFAKDNSPEDLAEYLRMSFSPQIQAAELAQAGSLFIILEIDGAPTGFTRLLDGSRDPGLDALPDFQGRHLMELVRIYLLQVHTGQRLGDALMQASLEQARKLGVDWLWLGVWEHNPRAIAFYRRWGFEKAGRHTFQLGAEAQTDFIMVRTV